MHRQTEAEIERHGGSDGGGGSSGGRDREEKRDIAEDERWKSRRRRKRAEGTKRDAKGSNGRVATSGGAEGRYENGVKEKKARLPSKL